MEGAFIILFVTVAVGLLLYVYDLKWRRQHRSETPDTPSDASESDTSDSSHGEICCGRHLVCEKSLSPEPGEKIIYYEDEELDRFAGKPDTDYTEDEEEEFREVMTTLLPADLPGWVRSLQLRGINFPLPLRDELFLLLECGE